MANVVNIDAYQGDARTLTFVARDYANNVVNLTGAAVTWMIGVPNGGYALSKAATIVSAAAGTFSVALQSSDTANIPPRDWAMQARAIISGAETTVLRGRFRLRAIIDPPYSNTWGWY